MQILRLFILALTLSIGLQAADKADAATAPAQPTLSTDSIVRVSDKHIIAASDTLEVKVYQEDELSTKVRVDRDGTISLPLIGNLKVLGQTIEEARTQITDLLQKDYLHDPQVVLTVVDFAKRRFAVLGQVARPGYYEFPSNETVSLLQAIATAGGYTKIADPSKITVKRSVSGKETVTRLNAKTMASDKGSRIFEVQADDTITVGESIF